jgi:hypothetical protein
MFVTALFECDHNAESGTIGFHTDKVQAEEISNRAVLK